MSLRILIKKIYLWFYNKKNFTMIKSVYASIHANYGDGVLIDRGTVVEQDVCIGDYSYVNKNSTIENCVIGKYCSISSGVHIGPLEHDLKKVTTHPVAFVNEREKRKKVHIGNDVLISLNSIILEGVTIGNGSVIAAGAVVTKDVKPYEIVGGVPAKNIGYRASKDKIEHLLEEKWWEWDRERILERKKYLSSYINID